MGCRSDYMEPTDREKESVLVCNLLIFAFKGLKKKIPADVTAASKEQYGDLNRLDEHTALLCQTCGDMSHADSERIIYDAHSEQSRKLAEWWDRHQAADKARIAEERANKKKQALVKSAKSKLTQAELDALKDE